MKLFLSAFVIALIVNFVQTTWYWAINQQVYQMYLFILEHKIRFFFLLGVPQKKRTSYICFDRHERLKDQLIDKRQSVNNVCSAEALVRWLLRVYLSLLLCFQHRSITNNLCIFFNSHTQACSLTHIMACVRHQGLSHFTVHLQN